MTDQRRLDHAALFRSPARAPLGTEWSALALVEGFAVYREKASFEVVGAPPERQAGAVAAAAGRSTLDGFVEHRIPATALLWWRTPEERAGLLSALTRSESDWSVSIDAAFAGNVNPSMELLSEDEQARTQSRFTVGAEHALMAVPDSSVGSEKRSGDEIGVGFIVRRVQEGAIAWRSDGAIESAPLGRQGPWACELIVRLTAACGFKVPSRLETGLKLPPDFLSSLQSAADSCRDRVVQAIEAMFEEDRAPAELAKACTTALLLDGLCVRPSSTARMTLLRLRADAREDLGRRSAALSDAKRSFRLAGQLGNPLAAAKAALLAYATEENEQRSERWARRAASAAAAARSVDDWAFAKEVLGDSHRRSRRDDLAIRCYKESLRALSHWKEAPAWRLARVYRDLSACWKRIDDHAEQLATERECFRHCQLADDPEEAARSALRLSHAHWIAEQPNDAHQWALQAIDLAVRCEDAEVLGEAHSLAGQALESADDAQEALRHCRAAIECYSSLERLPHQSLAWLHERAAESDALDDLDQRRMHSERAVQEFDLAGRRSYAVDALHRLCRIAWEEDRDAEAIGYAQDALSRAKGRSDRASSMMVLGEAFARTGRVEDAMAQFKRAAPLNRRIRPLSPDWSARFHRKLAEICRDAGKTAKAEREEQACLECCTEARDWEAAADSAMRLAADADSREDRTAAQAWHGKAVGFAERSGDANLHALALELQGDSLQSADDFEAALDSYRESFETLESRGDTAPERRGRILREIMYCEEELGRWDAAARAGTAAIENFLGDECWFDAAGTADELAAIALEQDDEAGRRRWHERTLEFARRCESIGDLALAYELIGMTLRTHDRPEEAIPYLKDSLRTLASWPESTPSRIARVHGELARCHATLGEFTAARDSALAALKAHFDADEPGEALDLVESLDPAFLADPTAGAVKSEAIRLAEESEDDEFVQRATDLESG